MLSSSPAAIVPEEPPTVTVNASLAGYDTSIAVAVLLSVAVALACDPPAATFTEAPATSKPTLIA